MTRAKSKVAAAVEAVMHEEQFEVPVVEAPKFTVSAKYEQYVTMATAKNVEPKAFADFKDDREIGGEMAIIYSMPTLKQQELVRSIQERMGTNPVPYSFFYGRTSQEVSDLIAMLVEREKATAVVRPATEQQAEYIADMFFCPDVDFSELSITTKIVLDESTVDEQGNVKQMWRRPTRAEMIADIQECVRSAEAREFINKYREPFGAWKKGRPTRGKIEYAIMLQERMANTRINKPKMEILDDGSIVEVPATNEWAPVGYVGYTQDQLAMMSIEEIDKYIDQLKSENAIVRQPYTNTDDAELKKKFDALESKGLTNEEFVYALMAIEGCEDELLAHNHNKAKHVMRYVQYLVDNGFASKTNLLKLAQNNEFATACVKKA
jgi:hypothetical protein